MFAKLAGEILLLALAISCLCAQSRVGKKRIYILAIIFNIVLITTYICQAIAVIIGGKRNCSFFENLTFYFLRKYYLGLVISGENFTDERMPGAGWWVAGASSLFSLFYIFGFTCGLCHHLCKDDKPAAVVTPVRRPPPPKPQANIFVAVIETHTTTYNRN